MGRGLVGIFFLFFAVIGHAENHNPSGRAVATAYVRPSVAPPQTGHPARGVPLPPQLIELFGPRSSAMSESDRMVAEMQAYLRHEPYQEFMQKRIHEAAQRIADPGERAKMEKMTLSELVAKWRKENPKLNVLDLAVSLAILEVGGSSVLGGMNPGLCETTAAYAAKDAANNCQLGHDGFGTRYHELVRAHARAGYHASAAENEAESSAVLGPSLMAHAQECVRSWWYSEGHKKAMMDYHSLTCHTMRRGSKGVYYCIGQFINHTR